MNAPVTATIEDDHADDLEPCPIQQGEQCKKLWAAALALYLQDAVRHATEAKKPLHVDEAELQAAYFDLVELGPMLTHLCNRTGNDPAWIRDRTLEAIDDHRDGLRQVIRTGTKRGGRQRAISK